jgi:hypothetical protein
VFDVIVVPVVIIGLLLSGLRLRARIPQALPVTEGRAADGDWVWIASRGVTLDEATRRDAAAYADLGHLAMADLVPASLPATAARDLLRAVDPRAYPASRLAAGHSAGAAMLADPALLKRAEAEEDPALTAPGPDAVGIAELARRIRPYAGVAAAIVIAPQLRSPADDLAVRKARLKAGGVVVGVHIALDVIPWALTAAALAVSWQWGLAALAVYCLQPYLVFGGTAMRPRGLHAAALLRPLHDPYVWARIVAGRSRPSASDKQAELAKARAYYQPALAEGTERFYEERRGDCPWCGSAELAVRVRSGDITMQKPGMFTLEQCASCGHTFQNPRLSPEGLDFYYRDFYDGLGTSRIEEVFLLGVGSYHGRARLPQPFTVPRTWLDVGAGHGHFCAVAMQTWPETIFDGLDQGAGIEEAQRRGWISTAYRGQFPELASGLAGRYDVVSMHHYLEHTREPLAELDAAAVILPPGGYLQIEVPDPQWRLAGVFGKYWMPWFQPQHQHMIPLGNLLRALEERGLQPVRVQRGSAHQANDLVFAALLMLSRLAPDRTLPWSSRQPTALSRARKHAVWAVGAPAAVAGLILDQTVSRAAGLIFDRGNAYRVLARKQQD